MTKADLETIKAGDILVYIDTKKEYVVGKFSVEDGMIWLDIYEAVRDMHAWLPFYYYELEFSNSRSAERKCSCDFYKVILVRGCQCGGE